MMKEKEKNKQSNKKEISKNFLFSFGNLESIMDVPR